MLRKIFGAKRDEVTGEWRKLYNDTELHALYSSPDIIRNIKSRRLKWAGHVARMGESRNAYRVVQHRKLPSICSYWVEGKPRKKPQPGNLPQPGIEPGPPGFVARRADRYSTGVDPDSLKPVSKANRIIRTSAEKGSTYRDGDDEDDDDDDDDDDNNNNT
ncbi:hypothetical protein ANN_11806 [Periplaneta americana]|uniref:Uncharacterized protein n=1 Tax=Periplaneta americana TaxID=6978 RepID=A0ABQ8T630_PERAM|nr:hypothetical protein ANN_11806 [Periplaneta americana]